MPWYFLSSYSGLGIVFGTNDTPMNTADGPRHLHMHSLESTSSIEYVCMHTEIHAYKLQSANTYPSGNKNDMTCKNEQYFLRWLASDQSV